MAKRRKGNGKHYKKDVDDISENTKKGRKSKSDKHRRRESRRNKKLYDKQKQARKRRDDIIFFSVLTIIVASIFGAYFAYDIYFKDNDDNEDENNYHNNGGGSIPAVGDQAPNFELTDVDGVKFELNDYRGNVVVLDFMADYCVPCHDQMIHLNEIYIEYDNLGVKIISIGISDKESSQQIRDNVKYAHDCQWRFAALGSKVAEKYGVTAIPAIFVLDEEGKVVFMNEGLIDSFILREKLDQTLEA
jgi:peroxiredoxin